TSSESDAAVREFIAALHVQRRAPSPLPCTPRLARQAIGSFQHNGFNTGEMIGSTRRFILKWLHRLSGLKVRNRYAMGNRSELLSMKTIVRSTSPHLSNRC